MSGDVPRAHITNIIWNEVIGPFAIVILTVLPYLFINAQSSVDPKTTKESPALIRIGIVAIAPIVVNLGICTVFFVMACCMGPLLSMCCKKFGAVLAGIAHAIATIMLIAFFEVLWYLENWNFARAMAGMIAITAIQRFIYKLMITFALTREFRTDNSNTAFWNGKWYGLGLHAITQPGRELLCKTTEMGFFATDCLLGHFILFLQMPFIVIPYIDRIHSVMLFWLRPSKQIRPPIYSSKVSKLRKRRVIRFAVLYFVLLIVFVALLVGPVVAGKYVPVLSFAAQLQQPIDRPHNDTAGFSTLPKLSATTAL